MSKHSVLLLVMLLSVLPLLAACGGDDDDQTVVPAPQPTQETGEVPTVEPPTAEPTAEPEDVTITIGVISDITGPSAGAHALINMALDDLAEYFNEEVLAPGVELKIITYDGQNNPSKDIPGYEWLREKGADLIFTGQPTTALTLKPIVDGDEIVMFVATGEDEAFLPPGYVFSLASMPRYEALTLLKWIAENDWDYLTNGPARIGGAVWNDAWGEAFFAAMEEYAEAHPDQFEWAGGHLTPLGTMTWAPEVEALNDVDYVVPCQIMSNFVREYRNAGHEAKFIGAGVHSAFFRMIHDARLWDEINGMLFVNSTKWWGEEGTLINLTKDLLYANHPDKAEEIMEQGSGYVSASIWYAMFDIIAKTLEATGPENFNSQALYDTARSYSLTVDDVELYSFGETERLAVNFFRIYEASEAAQDIVVTDPEWIPVIYEP